MAMKQRRELQNKNAENRKYEVSGVEKGIAKAKRLLNHLHTEMVLGGFTEGHVHQENEVRLCFQPSDFVINLCGYSTL